MHAANPNFRYLLAILIFAQSLPLNSAQANPIVGQIKRFVQETSYHGSEPETCQDGAIEDLAENIDWLEHYIDTYGSIVAKQPDIWGEARLTKHRDEYERMMVRELNQFKNTINGSISQQDGAFLAQALALSNAVSSNPIAISQAVPTKETPSIGTSFVSTTTTTKDEKVKKDQFTQNSTAQFAGAPFNKEDYNSFGAANSRSITLEPVVQLDQMSRYLNHLHELRRINEGDDTSDSPGYSMNLVRIPVSILPGKITREGFGAEVTVTASPVLTDDLMSTTFRNLVINDVVDQYALMLVRGVENLTSIKALNPEEGADAGCDKDASMNTQKTANGERQGSGGKEGAAEAYSIISVSPFSSIQNGYLPFSSTSLAEIFSIENLLLVAEEFNKSYYGRHSRWNGQSIPSSSGEEPEKSEDFKAPTCNKLEEYRVNIIDARKYLRGLASNAYDLLSMPKNIGIYHELARPGGEIARAIKQSDFKSKGDDSSLECMRKSFYKKLHGELGTANNENENDKARNEVEAFAWALLVESAMLNDRLNQDVRKLAVSRESYSLDVSREFCFFLPETTRTVNEHSMHLQDEYMAACQVFQEYVRVRWPIHVFSVDPKEQDQNIAEISQRKRELQFAMALGFISGNIGANTLTQYARRIDTQVETIGLNRTVVGFGHGNDTFGWRFQPRVQSLDVPGTFGSIRETLCGASRDYDLKHRKLEPGKRECVAIVLMPSFVPYADFDIRTNWYKLTNPKNSALTMKDSVRLSRAVTSMRNSRAQCAKCQHLYREGELRRLFKRVDQLDRELPLQTLRSQIPYENTLGGFEMFNTGVTDLTPKLDGWHGAPGIDLNDAFNCNCKQDCPSATSDSSEVAKLAKDLGVLKEKLDKATLSNVSYYEVAPVCSGIGTSLFLVGDNFSVHDTKVIAGGVCIPHIQLISRDLMRVTIPPCVNTITLCENGKEKEYVAIYVATPHGVTNHLHVPVINTEKQKNASEQKKLEIAVNKAVDTKFAKLDIPEALATVEAGNSKIKLSAYLDVNNEIQFDDFSQPDRQVINYLPKNDPRLIDKKVVLHAAIKKEGQYRTPLIEIYKDIDLGVASSFNPFGTKGEVRKAFLGELKGVIGQCVSSKVEKQKLDLTIVYYVEPHKDAVAVPLKKEVDVEIIYRSNGLRREGSVGTDRASSTLNEPEVIEPGLINARDIGEELSIPSQHTEDCGCTQTAWDHSVEFAYSPIVDNQVVPVDNEDAADLSVEVEQQVAELRKMLQQQRIQINQERSALTSEREAIRTELLDSERRMITAMQMQKYNQQTPTTVNVQLSQVGSESKADETRFWSEENHPLVKQMKTKVYENWRNVRDQLPCY